MFERFAKALKVAVRDEGFVQILGTGVLLVIVGTLTYTTSQDWSLVDGFYFAVATLTTASIADPQLVITGGPIKNLHGLLHPGRHRRPGRDRPASRFRIRRGPPGREGSEGPRHRQHSRNVSELLASARAFRG
jgi:hypothetical protein